MYNEKMENEFVIIDLFCGAGGTSLGFERAVVNGKNIAQVIACVNHDRHAIRDHSANFPKCQHFTEDVRKLDVHKLPRKEPGDTRTWILWASLECTHFSNAKTGPRNADSRTLAHALYPYIQWINPDLIKIENVREFLSWGELDAQGKPVNRKKGIHYINWVHKIESFGYRYNYQLLNSADFGSHQSRLRYFGVFAKPEYPIVFPRPTHSKDGKNGLPKWRPVREVLQLEKPGQSIFGRKKPLSPKTLKRILAGLIKFVPGGTESYLVKHYGGDPAGKCVSIENPAPTITTIPHESFVQIRKSKGAFICQYNGAPQNGVFGTGSACRTITVKDRFALVRPWIDNRTINGNPSDIDKPAPTLVTCPTQSVVTAFIDNQFGTGVPSSIDSPSNTILGVPKRNLVTASSFLTATNFDNLPVSLERPSPTITANRKYHYLVNPQFGWPVSDIEKPSFTLIAKMGKRPPYLLSTEQISNPSYSGDLNLEYFKDDTICPEQRIRAFMACFGISDICMRMLTIVELKRIQGLGDDYILNGSQERQKKHIGNAVVPHVVTAWAVAYYKEITNPQVEQLQMIFQ